MIVVVVVVGTLQQGGEQGRTRTKKKETYVSRVVLCFLCYFIYMIYSLNIYF